MTSSTRLANALKFTEADLKANRQGRISEAQRQPYATPQVNRIAIYVVLGHAALLIGVFGALAIIVNKPALWGILLLVGGLALLPFMAARNEFLRRPVVQDDINRGRVESVCGVVELSSEKNRYHIVVAGRRFANVTLRLWGAFSADQPYCIYYLPQSAIILSAEPTD